MCITIRLLHLEDLEIYKNIRLELLEKEPVHFGSSHIEEGNFDSTMWKSRLAKPHIDIFGAFSAEILIGILVAVRNPRQKIRHVATFNSMYVKEKYRSLGIAKKLIEKAIKHLEEKEVEIINLSVVTTNTYAIALYQKFEFNIYGLEKKGIKYKKQYIDLYLMTKHI